MFAEGFLNRRQRNSIRRLAADSKYGKFLWVTAGDPGLGTEVGTGDWPSPRSTIGPEPCLEIALTRQLKAATFRIAVIVNDQTALGKICFDEISAPMIERVMKKVGLTSTYSTEITQLDNGHVLRFRLLRDGEPLSWSGVVNRWQNDQSFRCFFVSTLVDAPFPAYFWETPPVTSATINREFAFVLVDSHQLAGVRTDQQAFANHFASAQPGASVIEFSNRGGDATLVVPCPHGPLSAYSQIAAFARRAPDDQQHQLWTLVGAALERQLGAQPVWLSTSGLGVYWLHIRLDSAPKYYTHEPYRS